METYTPAPEEALEPSRSEREKARPTAPESREESEREPSTGEEPVTPYDHLWFERRPLS